MAYLTRRYEMKYSHRNKWSGFLKRKEISSNQWLKKIPYTGDSVKIEVAGRVCSRQSMLYIV